MILNAVVTFYDTATGQTFAEEFCDPNIYLGPDGNLWHWNDKEWHRGMMTWGGQPIPDRLLLAPEARQGGPPPSSTYPAAVVTN